MSVRIPWNQHEVALLIDAYRRVAEGADLNQTAVELSQALRNLALRGGHEIDETYRNVNGIKMQLGNVQFLFTNGEHGLSGASTLIKQMWEVYCKSPIQFQKILREAIQLTTESRSVEEAFYAYAHARITMSDSILCNMLEKASDYCRLPQPLLGMTDVKTVREVQQKIEQGNLLRFRYGKDAKRIREATQLYYYFVKSYHEKPAVTVVDEVQIEHVEAHPIRTNSLEDLVGKTTPVVPVIQESAETDKNHIAPTVIENWQSTNITDYVDFHLDQSYQYTKPVSYTYRGVVHPAYHWIRVYEGICSLLYRDYPDRFMAVINSDLPGYDALAFADEQNRNRMRLPRRFAPGFYLEANLSASSIVGRLCSFYSLFGLGDNLKIKYRKIRENQDKQVSLLQHNEEEEDKCEAEKDEWIIEQLKIKKLLYLDKRSYDGCLWIVGGHELDTFVQKCKEKGYALFFKADGCKTFPDKPVWWTKDQLGQGKANSTLNHAFNGSDMDDFRAFLMQKQGLAERTAGNYRTSIRMIEEYIQHNQLQYSLIEATSDNVQRIVDTLMARPDFVKINDERHHQYSAAMSQYIIYLRQGGSISDRGGQRQLRKKTIIETVFYVLRQAGKPMTVSEIYQAIIRDDLYPFGAQDPQSVVYSKVCLACRQTDDRIKEGQDVLIRSEAGGRKMFQVMSAKDAAVYLQVCPREREQETTSSWAEYEAVLKQAFQKGFQKESGLDMKKLRKRWTEIHGEELKDSDDVVRLQLATHCVDTGKRWYLAELLLSEDDRQKVLKYIDRVLGSGKSVLYYSSIYAALEHHLESVVLTEDLLACYLQATCKDRYILREHYLTNDRHVQVELSEEIKDVMLALGRPIHTDELKRALHHLPPDQVERELHLHSEFIMDAFHTYFHESMADLTPQELNQIATFIQEELDDQGYMIGDWIQRKLTRLYPETAERLSFLTLLGVRGAVAYKLRDRFTFSGPVITPKGKAMNMIDIFAMFCQRHTPFTLDELAAFAKECDSTIYLDTVHSNCARVSEKEFVATEAVCWDVPHIDAAIALRCPGKYVSLKSIQYFDAFPYVGYSWNNYLLEQYVATVSRDFTLMHSSYAKNNTSGAIVRRDAGFESFDVVLADILANAPVDLEKDSCLGYLADAGYITRRKISNINEIITRAKMLRSQKG